jgi:hypothetical protein
LPHAPLRVPGMAMKCGKCGSQTSNWHWGWEWTCPVCGQRSPLTWSVLVFVMFWSLLLSVNLWQIAFDGQDDPAHFSVLVLDIIGLSYSALWFAVIWRRRRRARTPGAQKAS